LAPARVAPCESCSTIAVPHWRVAAVTAYCILKTAHCSLQCSGLVPAHCSNAPHSARREAAEPLHTVYGARPSLHSLWPLLSCLIQCAVWAKKGARLARKRLAPRQKACRNAGEPTHRRHSLAGDLPETIFFSLSLTPRSSRTNKWKRELLVVCLLVARFSLESISLSLAQQLLVLGYPLGDPNQHASLHV